MRRDDLYVADLADTTRAIREHLDSISRAQWDEDRVLRMPFFTGCSRTTGAAAEHFLYAIPDAAPGTTSGNQCTLSPGILGHLPALF